MGTLENSVQLIGRPGMDPEVNVTGIDGGIEWWDGFYPRTRSFILGVQLTF
jgi:hypothetical protein